LGYPELQQLIQNAELHNEKQNLLESKKINYPGGGGRKPKLSIQEQIILTLVLSEAHDHVSAACIQFKVSESTANDTFNYWLPLFRRVVTI